MLFLTHRGIGYGSMSLPHIPNAPSLVKKDDTRPLSDTRKKKRKEVGRTDSKEEQQPMKNVNATGDMELSGTTAAIKPKHHTSNRVVCYTFYYNYTFYHSIYITVKYK